MGHDPKMGHRSVMKDLWRWAKKTVLNTNIDLVKMFDLVDANRA